ncbi:basic proline-rich protein-like [Cervus canadensis]|uniref:basic proline-rich protein-like n=1 Tax=Cervus canadensis TaxID=1574408 RepID=UPI001C9E8FDD|nr:basic proline-rich protein-like [Cervus canadensis]
MTRRHQEGQSGRQVLASPQAKLPGDKLPTASVPTACIPAFSAVVLAARDPIGPCQGQMTPEPGPGQPRPPTKVPGLSGHSPGKDTTAAPALPQPSASSRAPAETGDSQMTNQCLGGRGQLSREHAEPKIQGTAPGLGQRIPGCRGRTGLHRGPGGHSLVNHDDAGPRSPSEACHHSTGPPLLGTLSPAQRLQPIPAPSTLGPASLPGPEHPLAPLHPCPAPTQPQSPPGDLSCPRPARGHLQQGCLQPSRDTSDCSLPGPQPHGAPQASMWELAGGVLLNSSPLTTCSLSPERAGVSAGARDRDRAATSPAVRQVETPPASGEEGCRGRQQFLGAGEQALFPEAGSTLHSGAGAPSTVNRGARPPVSFGTSPAQPRAWHAEGPRLCKTAFITERSAVQSCTEETKGPPEGSKPGAAKTTDAPTGSRSRARLWRQPVNYSGGPCRSPGGPVSPASSDDVVGTAGFHPLLFPEEPNCRAPEIEISPEHGPLGALTPAASEEEPAAQADLLKRVSRVDIDPPPPPPSVQTPVRTRAESPGHQQPRADPGSLPPSSGIHLADRPSLRAQAVLHLPEKEPSPGALSSPTSAGWGTTPRSLLATAPTSSARADGHARPATTLPVLSGPGGGAVMGPALQGARGD